VVSSEFRLWPSRAMRRNSPRQLMPTQSDFIKRQSALAAPNANNTRHRSCYGRRVERVWREELSNQEQSATSSSHPIPPTTRRVATHRSRRPPLEPLLASPRDILQNKQRAISRDQHVQCAAADDHVAGVLDHAGEEVGGSRWQAVSFYVGARAVGAVAENAFGRAPGPAAFPFAWDVKGRAD
jgi:hypothetical protein